MHYTVFMLFVGASLPGLWIQFNSLKLHSELKSPKLLNLLKSRFTQFTQLTLIQLHHHIRAHANIDSSSV